MLKPEQAGELRKDGAGFTHHRLITLLRSASPEKPQRHGAASARQGAKVRHADLVPLVSRQEFSMQEFMQPDASMFLNTVYAAFLHRMPEEIGRAAYERPDYLTVERMQIVLAVSGSEEARTCETKLKNRLYWRLRTFILLNLLRVFRRVRPFLPNSTVERLRRFR